MIPLPPANGSGQGRIRGAARYAVQRLGVEGGRQAQTDAPWYRAATNVGDKPSAVGT